MADLTSITTFHSGNPNSIQGTGQVVYIEGTYGAVASATCPCGGLKQTDVVMILPYFTDTAANYAGLIYDQAGSTFSDVNGIVSIKPVNANPGTGGTVGVVIWRV